MYGTMQNPPTRTECTRKWATQLSERPSGGISLEELGWLDNSSEEASLFSAWTVDNQVACNGVRGSRGPLHHGHVCEV